MKRVNKTNARKLFNEGEKILIIGHKLSPKNIYNLGIEIQKDEICNKVYNYTYDVFTFDEIVYRFVVYNCNFECGYYPAFYVECTKWLHMQYYY